MKTYATLYRYRLFGVMLTCLLLQVFSSPVSAQCANAPTLKFHSPVLITGTANQPGAVYNFANVIPGVDAHVMIVGLYGGATLYNIDDSTGIGYYDAFQPYVGAAPKDTSYIDWRITFKMAGTNTDTTLACLAVTAVDVDGDGTYLKEFIEAATPGSFSVDPATNLSTSFDGLRSKAISPVANVALIDTNRREAMFQMNFINISSLDYRNGAISTYGSQQIRQTCIYFKPFFDTYYLLPVKLLSFSAQAEGQAVVVKWSATGEEELNHYTIQRSEDGKLWRNIGNVPPRPRGVVNHYVVQDLTPFTTIVYYRLMEVSIDGTAHFSSIVKIRLASESQAIFSHNTIVNSILRVQVAAAETDQYTMEVYSMSGALRHRHTSRINGGAGTALIDMGAAVPGLYILVVRNSLGEKVYHAKLLRAN